ncbi:MAG TPA: hypothetical protein P5232_01520 [Candidatus Moranbacteria bacterium]|nr:hypothetical protein [Candidatus Moranbacteria bacterium]
MKVKILLLPLVLVIAVAVFIWLVYPAYSNGVNGVSENYTKLKSEQSKLLDLQKRSENTNNLSAQISALTEKDILYAFIPESAKEEEIIKSLSSLASASSLLFFDTTIKQATQEKISEDESAITGEEPSALPKIKKLETEMKLAGNYEKIKEFLNSLGKFGRSNEFETLEINRNNSGTALASGAEVLSVNAKANFNVLKKAELNDQNVINPIFSSSKLETKVIAEIKNQKNTNNFQVNVEQKGKSNLFQP